MMPFEFTRAKKGPLELLFVGAHADDIEIGCGGTVLRLLAERDDANVTWVVFGSSPERAREAEASAAEFLRDAREQRVRVLGFENSFFPSQRTEIKLAFEELKSDTVPDVVFTHARHDLHQDHRLLSELTWNTFRDHVILEYEVPKYDGDLATPNLYVPLERDTCHEKTRLLMRHYASQRDKHWFDEELFLGLLRVRGMEARSPSGYAEGYTCRKLVL